MKATAPENGWSSTLVAGGETSAGSKCNATHVCYAIVQASHDKCLGGCVWTVYAGAACWCAWHVCAACWNAGHWSAASWELVVGAGAGQRCAGSTCAGAVVWCVWSTTRRRAGSCSGQIWSVCAGIVWCWLMYFCCFFRCWLRKCWKRWCRSRKCWKYLCWCCWLMCLR